MKKIFVLIFIVVLVAITALFGIKTIKKNKQIKTDIITNFKSEVIINVEDKVYGGNFFHSDNLAELVIQDPSNIDGMKITWEGKNQQICFDNVKRESKKFIVLEDSFLNLVVKIIDQISSLELTRTSSDGKYTTVEGNLENHKFTLNYDDNGYIKEINITCKNSRITFEYENKK